MYSLENYAACPCSINKSSETNEESPEQTIEEGKVRNECLHLAFLEFKKIIDKSKGTNATVVCNEDDEKNLE